MSKWIVVGDSTSHGGTVLNGDPILSSDGKQVARVSDMVACPKCKGVFPIVSGAPNFIGSNGQPVARHGDSTACGATLLAAGQVHGEWIGTGNSIASATVNAAPLHETAIYDEQIRLVGEKGKILADCKYVIRMQNGSLIEGHTDSQGYTARVTTPRPEEIAEINIEYDSF